MKNQIINKKVVILGVLTFLSFLLRLLTASSEVVYPDSCSYLSFTKSILNGNLSFDFREGVEEMLPPLYPITNAIFSFLVGDLELSGVIVSAIAGALLIIPVFYLAKAVYNEKAAWISSALVFFTPILIHWSSAILTESIFITLFVSGIAIGCYAIERGNKIFFFLCGAIIGLSYMTRVIGLVAIPVLGLWILYNSIRSIKSGNDIYEKTAVLDKRFNQICKEALTSLAILSLGFILITGLYLIRLHSFYGQWTLAGSYGSIKGTISYEGAVTMTGWENLKPDKVEESPYIKLFKKVTINARNYSISLLAMLSFVFIFVITGLFTRGKILYLVSFIIVYFVSLLVQPISPLLDERIRYLSPVLPLLLVIASGGITNIQGWIKWRYVKQVSILIAGIVLLSFILQFKMFPVHFGKFWDIKGPVDIREKVGLWMNKNLPHPIRVMSRKPYTPYYADAKWFITPATYDEVIKLANSKGVDYIIVDRSIEFYLRPELQFLFDPKQVPEDLKFIGGVRHPKTGELYIGVYKIKRDIIEESNKIRKGIQ